MYIETQILGDEQRRNKIVRFGFENPEETARTLGCIGVAKALHFEAFVPDEKTGRLTLPLQDGLRIVKADTLHHLTREVQKRARLFQFSNAAEAHQRLLSMPMSNIFWQILRAVNSTGINDQVGQGFLPREYLENVCDAMHLMRAVGAGKKIGSTAVNQILCEPGTRPVNLPEAVVFYEETDSFTSSFPLNVKATVATSLIIS